MPTPDRDRVQRFWRDARLPFVESRRACHSRACYRAHSHPTFSIGAVDAGTSLFTGACHGPVTLRAGTLVLVPASQVHACNPARGSAWSYQMLHLDAAWLQSVRGGTGDGVERAEAIRIVSDPAAYRRFCQLNALLFAEVAAPLKEAALVAFMSDCDAQAGWQVPALEPPTVLAERIRPAMARMRATPAACPGLDELAPLAQMSAYQLIRAWRLVTGMTPHAWLLNHHVNLAREGVREARPLAALAQELGFADQAHLQRVFKAHAGVTPGGYRR